MEIDRTTVAKTTCCFEKIPESAQPKITSEKSELFRLLFNHVIKYLVRKHFHKVRIKNRSNFELRNKNYANLFYGVHQSWWDGQIAYYLCDMILKTNIYMMIEELYRFPLLSKMGGFSVEKNSPQQSVKSLNYAAHLLKNPKNSVWLFPQGKVLPPDFNPIKFESGLTYIASKVEKINLIPISARYVFVREERPEVFLEVGEPKIIESKIKDKKIFLEYLEKDFQEMVNRQKKEISSGFYSNYEIIMQNKLALYKRLEPYFKFFVYDKRYL